MKRLVIIFLIVIIFFASALVYLNTVLLPTRIKSLLVRTIEERTHKKVSLESLSFDIFQGLVVRDFVLYDDTKTLASLKEGSCTFLIWPFFKKQVIIPNLKLKSAVILLQRRPDGTLNAADLLKPSLRPKEKFNILVNKISLKNSRIDFQDATLSPAFSKSIDNINLSVSLSTITSLKFQGEIPANPRIKISGEGHYRVAEGECAGMIFVKDASLKEFSDYFKNSGLTFREGLTDALIKIIFRNNMLTADCELRTKGIVFSRQNVTTRLDALINGRLQYAKENKQLVYSGSAQILRSDIAGLKFVEGVNNIRGVLTFDTTGFSSDKLHAVIFGLPVEGKIHPFEYKNPVLNLDIASEVNLASLQGLLKDKFNLVLPAGFQGNGRLAINLQTQIPSSEPPLISGSLEVANAAAKADTLSAPLENIAGRFEFTREQLKWSGVEFRYKGTACTTSGALVNFQAPGIQLALSAPNLALESKFLVSNKLITVSRLAGNYFNSDFSFSGTIDTQNPAQPYVDMSGGADIDLERIQEPLKKFAGKLGPLKPSGRVHAKVSASGNIRNIKSCLIQAELSSTGLSLYGLKAAEFFMSYLQSDGVGNIPLMRISLYDGTLEASGAVNLTSPRLPYWLSAEVKDVKIEKLKLDTPAKQRDISGVIQAQAKINGFSNDLSKLNGAGKISIKDGRLWELNLFKGFGKLIFAREFAHVVFYEGNCTFTVQDKAISTQNLKMKSAIAEIIGRLKVGFDSSLDGMLNVSVIDEMVPLSGTIKDVTTAIIGQADRVVGIEVKGTLQNPELKPRIAYFDIIKSLKNALLP